MNTTSNTFHSPPARVAREKEIDLMSNSPSDRGLTPKPRTDSGEGGFTSPYFTLRELTRSSAAAQHSLNNTPDAATVASLQALVTHVLDPLRRLYGHALMVNSGYRSPAVNAAVGGAATSQHLRGEAADITTGSPEGNRRLLGLILAHCAPAAPRNHETREGIAFDQLIAERCDRYGNPRWLHISYSQQRNRNQVLYA